MNLLIGILAPPHPRLPGRLLHRQTTTPPPPASNSLHTLSLQSSLSQILNHYHYNRYYQPPLFIHSVCNQAFLKSRPLSLNIRTRPLHTRSLQSSLSQISTTITSIDTIKPPLFIPSVRNQAFLKFSTTITKY